MELFIILVVIFAAYYLIAENSKSYNKSDSFGPITVSTNVLVLPDLTDASCETCGNKDINQYRDLDSYTFDICCYNCKSIIWENPNREKRMKQINDMLD